jgi:hypothetical protein
LSADGSVETDAAVVNKTHGGNRPHKYRRVFKNKKIGLTMERRRLIEMEISVTDCFKPSDIKQIIATTPGLEQH